MQIEQSGTYSVELMFNDPEKARACLKDYRATGRRKKIKAPAKKRLLKHRSYRLPDGTEFHYYGLWDHRSNLLGKVKSLVQDSPDFVRLENKIVKRSVLEQCEQMEPTFTLR